VSENFDLEAYFDPGELIRDVKKQFEFDGSYFPPEAGKNIKQTWLDQFGYSDRALDVESDQRETLDDIRMDYRNRFTNFFENTGVPEGTEYIPDVEETLATPPPVTEQLPDVTPEQQNWFTGGFRSLGNRIWKLLGR